MQRMKFDNDISWHRACAAMVREGVTFDAFYVPHRDGTCEVGYYCIEFTGGY